MGRVYEIGRGRAAGIVSRVFFAVAALGALTLLLALELHAHDTLIPHHEEDFKQLTDRRALATALTILFVLGLTAAAVFIYKNADAETNEADDR